MFWLVFMRSFLPENLYVVKMDTFSQHAPFVGRGFRLGGFIIFGYLKEHLHFSVVSFITSGLDSGKGLGLD